MDKEKKIDSPEVGTEEVVDESLQKSLDKSLGVMQDLIKSTPEEDDVNELMKSAAGRAKMKKKMAEYDNEEEDDDDDDEKKKKMCGGDHKKTKKMKKSFDEVIEANDEVIDAVPVLKSFVETMSKTLEVLGSISGEISELKKSQDTIQNLQKSMGTVLAGSTELIKSFSAEVEEIAEQAEPVKGVKTKIEVLNKSFNGGEEKEESTLPSPEVLGEALQKSFQAGEINGLEISKWEMSNYNPTVLSPKTIQAVSKHLTEEVA